MDDFGAIAALVRQNEVGRRAAIRTPFGRRLVTYADLTATGRFLHFVEAWFRHVLPFYANTHTAISSTGRMMSELREEARRVIARAVHAGPDHVVVFVGSGATAAVNKLVGLLGIRIPEPLEREWSLARHVPAERRPAVLVGPYEHHSNELPWLETIADVVEVPLDACGRVDVAVLEAQLERFRSRPLRLGAFSAASNVTGVLTDVRTIARVLHLGGAYACFDYAAAAPYVPIDMNPGPQDERIDALFVSTHKFVGGPGGSGILVAHKDLFRSRVPERPGGGTVDYVSAFDKLSVDYVRRLDEREEGGTPNILGDLRAGAAFLVKELLGPERILEHDVRLAQRAVRRLSQHPRIRLYGPTVGCDRLPLLSFNVERLHHDFVAVLLDHLFGIQNRPGCSCAGPYGHRLLGIERPLSERYRARIACGLGGLKPGWVRLSLPYYASEDDVEFILSAVEFVAERGDDFLPLYRFGWRDAVWTHAEHPQTDVAPIELSLEALREAATCATGDHEAPISEAHVKAERERYFAEALRTADELRAKRGSATPAANVPTGDPEIDPLVWFRYVLTDDAWRTTPPAREGSSCTDCRG